MDISELDVESDMRRAEGNTWAPESGREMSVETGNTGGVSTTAVMDFSSMEMELALGEVVTMGPLSLEENYLNEVSSAPPMPDPFMLCNLHDESEADSFGRKSYFFDEQESKSRILKVFCSFLHDKPLYISLLAERPKGEDLIKAVLMQALAREREQKGFTTNEKSYRLFMSDGEGHPEIAVNHTMGLDDFDCFCIQAKPIAHLDFHNRPGLYPSTASDIRLQVHVVCMVENKVYHHECIAPADMLAERLEPLITRLLPNNPIVRSSLRICYGNTWLRTSDECDFGPGVGGNTGRVGEHTMLSLYRCGVREVKLGTGSARTVMPTEAEGVECTEISLDDAKTTQNIPVVQVTENGTLQHGVLRIVGEFIVSVQKQTKQRTARRICDIEEVEIDDNKMNIIYKRRSRLEADTYRFVSPQQCLEISTKLKLLVSELNRREEASRWGVFSWLRKLVVRGKTEKLGDGGSSQKKKE